jgi:hypothetical protein
VNRIRRSAVLVGLTAAVIVGSSIPAAATFTEGVSTNTATLRTVSVAAPSSMTVSRTCTQSATGGYYDATGQWVTTYTTYYNATATWPASTTARGVTGYRVTAYLPGSAPIVMGETDAANRSLSASVDASYLAYQPTISVTTLTSYGWSTESVRKAVPTC